MKEKRGWGEGRGNLHEPEALSGSRTKFIAGIEREKVRGGGRDRASLVGLVELKENPDSPR